MEPSGTRSAPPDSDWTSGQGSPSPPEPATSFAIIATTGNTYSGLWYPVIIAAMTVVIGVLFVPNTHNKDIFADTDR
jgi:H+/gluconate symporter-like permease